MNHNELWKSGSTSAEENTKQEVMENFRTEQDVHELASEKMGYPGSTYVPDSAAERIPQNLNRKRGAGYPSIDSARYRLKWYRRQGRGSQLFEGMQMGTFNINLSPRSLSPSLHGCAKHERFIEDNLVQASRHHRIR